MMTLSPAYLKSVGGAAEWQAVWAADIEGRGRRVVPVLVEDCDPAALGLLRGRGWVDMRGLFGDSDAEVARARLLDGVVAAREGRRKPSGPVPLPGRAVRGPMPFPLELPEIWNVPPRVAHFVGREELLGELHAALSASSLVALAGLGGVGKTAVALEYAYRHATAFDVVWWVPAERMELVREHLAALGEALGLAPGAELGAVLARLRRHSRWLLVFDNAEDPVKIAPLRPGPGEGPLP